MANRKRSNRIELYLSDDEQFILEEKFKLSKMPDRSVFLRQLILYGFVYDVDYSHLRNINTELGRISNNLNQITRRVNVTGQVYSADLTEIKEMMNQIWQLQKSILLQQPLIKQ
ncbi:MobC family plasmid mobilization relaxosome protein [Lachnospiraceae bacterium OttesenSCG-928-D06]|nr:MobC family plasmid mobilization relaxosome protein [Lachnospiraceae bacterium OttesenSCG-928-D06]